MMKMTGGYSSLKAALNEIHPALSLEFDDDYKGL
jgi:hypothetical protein